MKVWLGASLAAVFSLVAADGRAEVWTVTAAMTAWTASTVSIASTPQPMDAAQLAHALDRAANTGRVLYVAAHPDDENTRLLAYLANHRHIRATYLSLTRGGGGQNLIGAEQDELLDIIRTEELLAARGLDGASQRFSRMRDFGYSKSAKETLELWGHDASLADVVWVIRTTQPDVIVNRFDEKPPNHGHHTASAILAREAFSAAADPTRFPEQLREGVTPWQATRLVHNLSPFRQEAPPAEAMVLDVGAYDARLGLSTGELAAQSRSQHKSQGFGVAGERGELLERFMPVAGVPARTDLLDGIDTTWGRLGGKAVDAAFAKARKTLERDAPEKALPALLEVRKTLGKLPASLRRDDALADVERLILAAQGFFVRASSARPAAVPGSSVEIGVELIQRRPGKVEVKRVQFGDSAVDVGAVLALNTKKDVRRIVEIPSDAPVTSLTARAEPTQPRQQPAMVVRVELTVGGEPLTVVTPVVFSWTDRVHGERLRDFRITPPATVTPTRQAVLLTNGQSGALHIRVRAGAENLSGEVELAVPSGYHAKPARHAVALRKVGDETTLRFEISGPKALEPVVAQLVFHGGGRAWSFREDVIDHPHIPMQEVLRPATVRLVPLELRLPSGLIGYVPGSGDSIADDLAHVGANVETVSEAMLESGDLKRFTAIVVGIRAYNTRPFLRSVQPRLLAYAEAGGTLVLQYNTNSRFDVLDAPLGPYPFEVGRERVTDESAAVSFVDPKSALLTTPNRLGAADFAGWVQERGLYFAGKRDPRYQILLTMNDPDEPAQDGGLIWTRHGKGRFIYTGLSFFRQLPAGVPGAYRLLANLLSREGADGR